MHAGENGHEETSEDAFPLQEFTPKELKADATTGKAGAKEE